MRGSACAMAAAAALSLGACEQRAAEPAEANGAAAADAGAAAGELPVARAAADPQLQWGPCPEGMPEGCGIAVLNGDPARPNADIFLKVPGGAAIPPHAHSSAERMVLVSGELRVTYDGQQETVLRPGSYAYGPASLPHVATCAAGAPCVLFIAFESPVDAIPGAAGE